MKNDTKITPSHLSRIAYIYIRQSTDHQVRLQSRSRQTVVSTRPTIPS